jgi:hypothetical protein
MAAAWVSQYSPEHTQQFAINLLSEEDFFNFDMFREDLSQDLNFLFSESPEIPAASNEAADTMAIASQLPANPFEFNTEPSAVLKLTKLPSSNLGKCFRRLLVRASTTLTVFTIDMNEPTVLGLYTQLFMSQQDSTKKSLSFAVLIISYKAHFIPLRGSWAWSMNIPSVLLKYGFLNHLTLLTQNLADSAI